MQRWAWGLMGLLLVGVAGCKQDAGDRDKSVSPARAAPAVTARTPLHPCALLSDAAVAGAVAGAKPGQRDTGDEAYGISACRWAAGDEAVVLQVYAAGPGALPQELRSSSLEIIDIRRPEAATLVRLERLEDLADLAGAYVERADAKRGIRRSNAVLMVQRGDRLAVLRMPQIADGDREEALSVLKSLGTSIAKGL